MKMRRSLAQLEREFLYESELDQRRREHLRRQAVNRSRKRRHARETQRSSYRFYLLTLSLIATAVLVTAAMFATLYLLLT
jgi:hypothetical protein